jgi:hypothetical protein
MLSRITFGVIMLVLIGFAGFRSAFSVSNVVVDGTITLCDAENMRARIDATALSATFDRDNTGNGFERVRAEVRDGAGTILYAEEAQFPLDFSLSFPAGTYSRDYTISPQYNPLIARAISLAGNDLEEQVVYTYQDECEGLPFYEEPVDPEEPIDPEEPVDPEEPIDPEEPVDPEEPIDPEQPIDPEEPIDPEQPIDPEEPIDPEPEPELTPAPAPTPQRPCLPVPTGSVVGRLTRTAQIFYAPGHVSPGNVLPGGQTFWVVGFDETGEYAKLVLACQYVWVEADAIGPNFEEPWFGAPLPDRVVQ